MTKLRVDVAAAVTIAWALLLYLIPLGVGLAVGAVPLRLISSGIFFDQSQTSFAGYRALLWSPIIAGIVMGALGMYLRPARWNIALGIVGTSFAATLLTVGGGLGIGPGGLLLTGTDIRWVWRICVLVGGLMVGLAGPLLLRTKAEDESIDVRALKREMLLSTAVLGVLILLLSPGSLWGKGMAGFGSWLGSLVWIVGL